MKSSVKIALIYTILGILWIVLSDSYIEIKTLDTSFQSWSFKQSLKGVLYVSITGLLLYILVERYHKRLEQKIIELQELNFQLKAQRQKLERSNAELEQFAHVVSHDLQEPLRMVHSFINQLKKKYDHVLDDKAKQYIFYALDGAIKMRHIILDLLEYAMVENSLEDNTEAIDLNQMIEEIKLLLHQLIKEKEATIFYEPLPSLVAVAAPIRHLFQNIIDNGIKYHREGIKPEIHISYEETDIYYKFYIKDNGIGIDAEYFEKIFVIFERLHNDPRQKGTGVGLAICKKIAQHLDGQIEVQENNPHGSTFILSLRKEPISKIY